MSRGDTRPSLCVCGCGSSGSCIVAVALATAYVWQCVLFVSMRRVLSVSGHVQSVRVLSGLRLSWITAAVLDSFRDAS